MNPAAKGANKARATRKKPEPQEGCTHHWVIDPPNGAVSIGHCRKCGEDREFRNSIEYSSWYGTRNSGKSKSK